MRILGIDPGYGITGFGLIEAERGQSTRLLRCGAITTPPNSDFSWRLELIYNDMQQLLEVTKPDVVAIEELFFGHNVTTGIGVAQSRGVILHPHAGETGGGWLWQCHQAPGDGYDPSASASGKDAQAR